MNNYDNAEPKPLKFLVSDGKLVDESGNVIAESDSLQELYIKSSPQVKKYLLSDGSVVDENNNLIIKNDYYKKVYDQATPKVAKYLHSDGTIDENSGSGGGVDLEDNHQTTIDVSTYTEPVEVVPESGKDGMKKATVTLDNIPSGGANAYAWTDSSDNVHYFNFDVAPNEITNEKEVVVNLGVSGEIYNLQVTTFDYSGYEKTSDSHFTTDSGSFERIAFKDFTLWQLSE